MAIDDSAAQIVWMLKKKNYRTASFPPAASFPTGVVMAKNKLARHLLAMSVVCFYACNDTLNSVVDPPPPHSPPSPPYVPFQGSSASKIVWMSAHVVFFVCFGPRSGLRCGGILWSDNSFHVPSLRCVWACVCVCFFFFLLSWQGSECKQWQWVAGFFCSLTPSWRRAILPSEGAPSLPGLACCSASGNSSWLRLDALVSADSHWHITGRELKDATLRRPLLMFNCVLL